MKPYPRIVTPPPGPNARAIIARDEAVTAPCYIKEYPLAIAGGQRRYRAIRSPHLAHIVHAEQKPNVAPTAKLVQLSEARSESGNFRRLALLERRELSDRRVELVIGRGQRLLGFALGLDLDVAFDFEAPQIDEQRLLARGERVGFFTESAKAVGGSLVGVLRAQRHRHRDCDDEDPALHAGESTALPTSLST